MFISTTHSIIDRFRVNLPKTPLFGTDGIRGKVGDLLTPSLAQQVGFWTGKILQTENQKKGPVIIGQDSRNSSNPLALSLSAGLRATGLEVWYLGLCPTPTVAYLTHISEAIGGVMISASHNPPEDNGIKIFGADGTKLTTALQKQIETGIRGAGGKIGYEPEHPIKYGYQYPRPELLNQYLQSLQDSLLPTSDLSGLRIVLDLAWGAAVNLAPQAFAQMGAEVICLHNQADGDRINVNCGSTHLAPLQAAVRENQADLGFAFDGDADRVIAVDGQGRVIDGDYILYFWGKMLQQQQQLPGNTIVSTVMANLGFEMAWKHLGGKLIRTAVGDQYVHAEMMQTGAMLGGEQSGHILCRHYGISGDGLLTALHLTALVQRSGYSMSQLREQSFSTYPQLLKNLRVEDRERRCNWQHCEPLQKAIAKAETAMGNQGRILVRASGTEPLIRVMVEAINADIAHYWSENLVSAVQQYL
ncbi:phosphoglucosamine mutase [Planktothrix agardhii CCAP 1459/11A]|uniref:Phosphoglucosamine mutase n=1 Tax=Planktothrix agardhii CCAP 1459/11A TaxID=282420 RepID=A0A4P5ZFW9_PLAAG|nr:phosphoglucosamine mutase [Planktothrix agardhii]GDZ94313.1 phosphoglucosamine mutase [Planktothrix agardhii CCAP 1459/11A]CAD5949756.1 Phosphoglucosamine mutase [Planktothrix rubescens]